MKRICISWVCLTILILLVVVDLIVSKTGYNAKQNSEVTAMNLTQEQLDTMSLPLRNQYIKLEVLDLDFKVIDTIEAECISGELTKNAEDIYRRSGNVTIAIPAMAQALDITNVLEGDTISVGGNIWIDKVFRISVGIVNYLETDSPTVWKSFGLCLIDQPVQNFSETEFTISFNVIDYIAVLSSDRFGQTTGTGTTIPQGENENIDGIITYVRTLTYDAIQSVIVDFATTIKQYAIYPIPTKWQYLPYDIKFEVGATVLDMLDQFMDILSTWQLYINDDGVLTIEPKPSGKEGTTFPLDEDTLTTNKVAVDFANVKNQVVIYGRTNSLDYYSGTNESFAIPTYTWGIPESTVSYGAHGITADSDYIYIGGREIISFESASGVFVRFNKTTKKFDTPIAVGGDDIEELINTADYVICGGNGFGIWAKSAEAFLTIGATEPTYDGYALKYVTHIAYDTTNNRVWFTGEFGTSGPMPIIIYCVYMYYDITSDTYSTPTAPFSVGKLMSSASVGNMIYYMPYGSTILYSLNMSTSTISMVVDLGYNLNKMSINGNYIYGCNTDNIIVIYNYATAIQQTITTATTYLVGGEYLVSVTATTNGGYFLTTSSNLLFYDLSGKNFVKTYNVFGSNITSVYSIYNDGSIIYCGGQDYISTQESALVTYSTNTLILRYVDLDITTLSVGGTLFGFSSQSLSNTLPFNKVTIYNGVSSLGTFDLQTFENIIPYSDYSTACLSANTFNVVTNYIANAYINYNGAIYQCLQDCVGIYPENTQYWNMIIPSFKANELYSIRIASGDIDSDTSSATYGQVLINSNLKFEIYGKQQVSQSLVNDNLESPYYINANISGENYYCGEAQLFVDSSALDSNNYNLIINDYDTSVTSLNDGTILTFTVDQTNEYPAYTHFTVMNSLHQTLVSDINVVQNVFVSGVRPNVGQNKIVANYTIYRVRYDATNSQFVFIGRNPTTLTLVDSGGEYDNIYADRLAYERCLWELYLHSNMNNAITISCFPNYALDVNNKISLSPNSALPPILQDVEYFMTRTGGTTAYQKFMTSDNLFFITADSEQISGYEKINYLTKTVTYPLGIDNSTSQQINAIQIYDSGNLVGSDYK